MPVLRRGRWLFILSILLVFSVYYLFVDRDHYVILYVPFGGLGDRLRPMVLAFYLAALTDRRLLVDQDFLGGSDFVGPNTTNWLSKSAKRMSKTDSKWFFHDADTHKHFLTETDFDGMADLKVFELHTNLVYLGELYENKQMKLRAFFPTFEKLYHQGRLWNHALRSLLRPTRKMASLIRQVERDHFAGAAAAQQPPSVFKIGIQIRAGDGKMANVPSQGPGLVLTRYVPDQGLHCFAQRAARYWEELDPAERAQRYPGGPVALISSDNSNATDAVRTRLKALGIKAITTEEYGGDILHLDKAPLEQKQTRTFLDWFLLGSMDRLVISISGFAETAAKYSCAPAALFHNFPGSAGHNNFEDCQQHFHEAGPTGLCQPGFDREIAEHLLESIHSKPSPPPHF